MKYPYNSILLNNKTGQAKIICSTAGPQKHYAKWKKQDT